VVLGFDRQGWITVFAALLLALITLFINYTPYQLHPCRPPGSRFRRPTAASRNSLREPRKIKNFTPTEACKKTPYGAKKSIKLRIKMTGMGSGGFR